MNLHPKRIGGLLWKAAQSWMADEAPRLSAALAFFAMLSLSPLLLTATSVAGFFYDQHNARQALVQQVRNLAGKDGASVVEDALENAEFSDKKSTTSTIVAGVLLLFTSTAVFVQLQTALNKVWGASPEELNMPMWKRILLIRGRSLAIVLVIGFLLIVSLVASAVMALLQSHLSDIFPNLGLILNVAYNLFAFLLMGCLFSLMFRFLPDTRVDTKAAWVGGLTTALLLTVGKWGIGLYLGNSDIGSAYGAAGSLVAFLVWIYYSMLMFFYGAEFTHTLSTDRLSGPSQEQHT